MKVSNLPHDWYQYQPILLLGIGDKPQKSFAKLYLTYCGISPVFTRHFQLAFCLYWSSKRVFVYNACKRVHTHTFMCVFVLILMLPAASCHHLPGSANPAGLWMMALVSFSRCLMEEWAKASFPSPLLSLNPSECSFYQQLRLVWIKPESYLSIFQGRGNLLKQ